MEKVERPLRLSAASNILGSCPQLWDEFSKTDRCIGAVSAVMWRLCGGHSRYWTEVGWKRCLKDLVAPKVRCLRRVPKKRDDGVNSGHAGHLFVPLGKSHEFPYTTMEQTHHHKSAPCMQRFSSHLRNLLVRPAGQPICCTWLEVSSKETITLRRYKRRVR